MNSSSSGRRVIVRATREAGGARAAATVDLGAFGMRLSDWASLEEVVERYLASVDADAVLKSATADRSKSGAARYYRLRFETAGGVEERWVKLAVQQSRLYMLTVDGRRGAAEIAAEMEEIERSFEAFPVSSMRGGLLRGDGPAVLNPVL